MQAVVLQRVKASYFILVFGIVNWSLPTMAQPVNVAAHVMLRAGWKLLSLFVLLVCIAGASTNPTSAPALPAPPDAAAQTEALTRIRSLYSKEYALHGLEERRAFARKLMKQG